MATFKGIMVFQDQVQTLGWSEVYYVNAATNQEALTKMTAIAQFRAQMLATLINISYIRITGNIPPATVGVRRQRAALLARVDLQGSYNVTTDKPDVAWVAAKVRFSDSTGNIFRTQLWRGISDEFWSNADDKKAAAAFAQFLPNYVANLVANSAQILHKNAVVPVTYTATPIATGQYEGLTRRATGRPLFLPRGRRSNRKVVP